MVTDVDDHPDDRPGGHPLPPGPKADRRWTESPRWVLRWAPFSYVLLGASFAVLVGAGGEPGWRMIRVGLVGLVWWAIGLVLNRGGAPRRILFVALGSLGTAVGIGIAVPHLWEGLTVAGIVGLAGLVLLVSSSILLVAGVAGILRATSGASRILFVPAAAVGLLLVWSVVVPAVAATNVPPSTLDAVRTPASVGLEVEDVLLRTDDGVLLAGWYSPGSNGAAVVVKPGAGSTRDDVLDEAAVLHEAGYAVLLVDPRGHGESEGQAMDLGWHGDQDTEPAISYLAGEPDVDPERIGVLGLSMGGEEAIGAAAADPRIAAVVAEGATGRTAADKAWYSSAYGLRGSVQEGLEHLQTWVVDLLTDAAPPTPLDEAVAQADDTSFLLVAAGQVDDEGRVAARLEQVAPDRVVVWEVPDADHVGGLEQDPDEWTTRVVAFFDDHLG